MNLFDLKHFIILFSILFVTSQLSKSSSLQFIPAAANNITLFGDACFLNNSIILTQEHNCTTTKPPPSTHATSLSGVGRAFLVNPIQFLDSSTNCTRSFSSRFSFTIISAPSWSSCPYGDGLAFVIVSNTDSFSFSDGYMGLPETEDNPQDSFLAVEFDTNFDPYLDDINDNHIAIDVDGMSSLVSLDAASKDIDLKSGRELTVWIEYRGIEKLLLIWAGYNSQVKPSSTVLEAKIDLLAKFKEFMHVGFSASNGKGSAIHSVNHWKFKTYDSSSSTKMPIESIDDDDCLICKPGEMNRLNDSSVSNHLSNSLSITGLVFGGFSVAVSIVVCGVCVWFKKRRKIQKENNEGNLLMLPGSRVLERMSLSEIKEATKGFNQTRIIGTGASAVVYEGRIPSRGSVAVKRFSQESKLDSEPSLASVPFHTEFATMVGCLRHKNLIQLQGWCSEKNELVLVYEYMANGSLDKILHKRTYFNKYLTWDRRMNIVLGVASALIYLHEECESQIIHRDVKTCNIMLDDNFNAKLGDFGLAEVYGHDSGTREATIPAGTMGYLAPEYAHSGIPTVKTDVYSFGIVILEVTSGRRPVDGEGTVITEWVWGLWEMNKLIEAADNKMMGRFDDVEMLRMLKVGLLCAHPDQEKRPTMKEAARMLTGEASLPVFPPRRPTVKIQSVLPESCEEIMKLGGEVDGTVEAPFPIYPPKKLAVKIQSVLPESCEEIMKLGGEVDGTPWSTPLSHFSKN
ncbi:hypothetical protein Leryth_025510 [Lithospermum erythrorhizon]|uniref:non-specific serine/threonine protein kinase n=1 Tax=Lithospermum erythrorhizon TaxID=34254 RepID=A0AAV3QR23_LITER|nr:hypothetical protein Leryth_025510 [Lithospermum erythrorhizon]